MATRTALDFKSLVSDPSASLCGNFVSTLLKFPLYFYQWINSISETNGDVNGVAKIGDYMYSASPLAETAFRKLANGQALIRANYPELFALIGVVYGIGDGSTTFNIPDHTARFPVGVGTFPSSGAVAIGQKGGEDKHSLDLTEIPPHDHFIANTDTAPNGTQVPISGSNYLSSLTDHGASSFDAYLLQGDATKPTVGKTSQSGGAGSPAVVAPHNNIPPFIGVYVYLRVR